MEDQEEKRDNKVKRSDKDKLIEEEDDLALENLLCAEVESHKKADSKQELHLMADSIIYEKAEGN